MRLLIVIAALMIALPAWAYNAGRSTAANGCVTTYRGNISRTDCPNGDWSRRDWSQWNARRWWSAPRRHVPRRSSRPRERVIERETLRYEHVIKQEVR